MKAALKTAGIVPVLRGDNGAQVLELARALVAGGIGAVEVTMTVPEAAEVIAALRAEFSERLLLGAGTVTDVEQAQACMAAGAVFVVTPVCAPEVVQVCHERGVAVALGAATPTEVWRAHRAGADVVKVFPAACLGGASYLAALRGPFPHISLMPTGGVTLDNLHEYTAAGARVVGIGSALADTRLLHARGARAIQELAGAYCQRFRELTIE